MHHSSMTKLFFLAIFATAIGSQTHGAVINVSPVIGGYFDMDFNPTPTQFLPIEPVIVQVDVMLEVVSLGLGESGFGVVGFSFDIDTCYCTFTPHPDTNGWNPFNPTVDSNGSSPGGMVPLFAQNGDYGASDQDLLGILVAMSPVQFVDPVDPRGNIGEYGSPLGVPILLGSAYFLWSGNGGAVIKLNPIDSLVKSSTGTFVPAQTVSYPVEVGWGYYYCPEPSSAILLSLCFGALAFARRC